MKKPLVLMILDGFGIAPAEGNAIAAAKHPNMDKIFAENPHTPDWGLRHGRGPA